MNRAAVILKNAREDKSLDLQEVSKKLKISRLYLEAIENEQISKFPAEPYCSMIIKDYAVYLGLNGSDILSLFRRDFATQTTLATSKSEKFAITPHSIFKVAVTISILFFVVYIFNEYLKFNRPPELQVNWPEDRVASNSNIEITGTTDPEATIRINNDLIIIDPTGKFQKSINLQSSEIKIVIESKSQSGKTAYIEKTYHPK